MKFDVRKLVCLMAEKRLSAKDLTASAGVGANTIRGIIKHGQRPTTVTLGKLSHALGVSPDALLVDEGGE
jgi:DNA-binding Xre family transcriptional regulator